MELEAIYYIGFANTAATFGLSCHLAVHIGLSACSYRFTNISVNAPSSVYPTYGMFVLLNPITPVVSYLLHEFLRYLHHHDQYFPEPVMQSDTASIEGNLSANPSIVFVLQFTMLTER